MVSSEKKLFFSNNKNQLKKHTLQYAYFERFTVITTGISQASQSQISKKHLYFYQFGRKNIGNFYLFSSEKQHFITGLPPI